MNIPRYVETFDEELLDIESVNKEIADIKVRIASLKNGIVYEGAWLMSVLVKYSEKTFD